MLNRDGGNMKIFFGKRDSAFTLVEVMFAIAIAGVIAVGLVSTMITSMKSQNQAMQMAQAQNLAQEVMEELYALSFSDLTNRANIPYVIADQSDGTNASGDVVDDVKQDDLLTTDQEGSSSDDVQRYRKRELGNLNVWFEVEHPIQGDTNLHAAKIHVWVVNGKVDSKGIAILSEGGREVYRIASIVANKSF